MIRDWERAVRAGDVENVRRLADLGANIDAKDRYGQTALMIAAKYGRTAAMRLLLERGAALDVTAKYGLSALMLATVNRHPEIVRNLVDAGADLTLRGSGAPGFHKKTALDLARDGGDQTTAMILEEAERRRAERPA